MLLLLSGAVLACGVLFLGTGPAKLVQTARRRDGASAIRTALRIGSRRWRRIEAAAGLAETATGAAVCTGFHPAVAGAALAAQGALFTAALGYARRAKAPGGCGCVRRVKEADTPIRWPVQARAAWILVAGGIEATVALPGRPDWTGRLPGSGGTGQPSWTGWSSQSAQSGRSAQSSWISLPVRSQGSGWFDWPGRPGAALSPAAWLVLGLAAAVALLLMLAAEQSWHLSRCGRRLGRSRAATLRDLTGHGVFQAMAAAAGPFGEAIGYRRDGCVEEFRFATAPRPGRTGRTVAFRVSRTAPAGALAVEARVEPAAPAAPAGPDPAPGGPPPVRPRRRRASLPRAPRPGRAGPAAGAGAPPGPRESTRPRR